MTAIKLCKNCGRENTRGGNSKYCCADCRVEAERKRKKKKREEERSRLNKIKRY